jgi:hypothetical protein
VDVAVGERSAERGSLLFVGDESSWAEEERGQVGEALV